MPKLHVIARRRTIARRNSSIQDARVHSLTQMLSQVDRLYDKDLFPRQGGNTYSAIQPFPLQLPRIWCTGPR